MTLARSALALAVVLGLPGIAACRFGFGTDPSGDAAGDGVVSDDDGAVSVEPWAALFGTDASPTMIANVVEDLAGDLWVVGESFAFGPSYYDGWISHLEGTTGDLKLLGVRRFAASGSTAIRASTLATTGVIVAGETLTLASGQQPAFGRLAFDGSWAAAIELSGAATSGANEYFEGIARTSDGGHIAVGRTRAGAGSCAGCLGVDVLAAKLDAQGAVEWARAYGTAVGDEVGRRVLQLPDGDYVIAGGGIGAYDYMGTADSPPSVLMRISPTGDLRWTSRLELPFERGVRLLDVVFDPASGQLVVAGHSEHGTVLAIARVSPGGVVEAAHEVYFDSANRGEVSSVMLSEDGGLYIAGIERVTSPEERIMFVARLSSTLEVVWARSARLASTGGGTRLVRARNGDLLAWTDGVGATGTEAMLVRMHSDGTVPACSPLAPAALQVAPLAYSSRSIATTTTLLQTTTAPAQVDDLPVDGTPSMRCSP